MRQAAAGAVVEQSEQVHTWLPVASTPDVVCSLPQRPAPVRMQPFALVDGWAGTCAAEALSASLAVSANQADSQQGPP